MNLPYFIFHRTNAALFRHLTACSALCLVLCSLAFGLTGCSPSAARKETRTGFYLNTVISITIYGPSSPELFDAFEYSHTTCLANPVDGIFIDELNELYPKLKEITNTRYIEMIVGETPIEGGFESFVEEWNSRGGQELTKALDEAYQAK